MVSEAVQEKAEWMQQIIEEEQSKPLEVDSDYLKDYETQERREEERLQEEVRRHIKSLRALRSDLRKREETRKRNMKYKMERAAFQSKQFSAEDMGESSEPAMESRKQPVTGTLSKVIHSLDKLVELEKRISHLEEDTGPASAMFANRTSLQFSKKTTNSSGNAPSKTYFAMRVKQGQAGNRGGSQLPRLPRGRADDGKTASSVPQVQRSRRQAPVRTRRADAKNGAPQQQAQRQDVVINDWLNKKDGGGSGGQGGRNRPGQRVGVGAASGKRSNNAHMQQFHDIRQTFEKKKDALARNLPGKPNEEAGQTKRRIAWEQKASGGNSGRLPRIGKKTSAKQRTAW